MITKISMNQVASYKNPTTLETDKKVNLIYGLNGTGKSILSDYLYERTNLIFSNCSIEGLTTEEILVYNQHFIKDYFYESENLKGIFTLSKENKEAEEKVINAEKEIDKLEVENTSNTNAIDVYNNDLAEIKQSVENKTWEIKTSFAGGDRVLEYCLSGLMGRKEALFNYLSSLHKPVQKPVKTISQLKKEIGEIQGSSAQKYDLLQRINFTAQLVESNILFQKAILGNKNSAVAELIKKLGNSDWVKKGLEYLPDGIKGDGESCPFCQERTITRQLVDNIKNYFDETYENDILELKKLLSTYETDINSIDGKVIYEINPLLIENKVEFDNLYNTLLQCLNTNKTQIIEKIKTPSQKVSLTNSISTIDPFNHFIDKINISIKEHNNKIDNKDASLADIKNGFWNIMRWDYDQIISAYQKEKSIIEKKIKDLKSKICDIDKKTTAQKSIVVEQQKKTINIEEAISNINNGLLDLGIDCFRIEKHSDALYKIVRDELCEHTFQTLSEGERMVISFLYFVELCKGKQNVADTRKNKIIIIDDPISSLSHIYVFNMGQLIKSNFTNPESRYKQVFILTHSLYFFYELTFINKEDRNLYQKLFRISKNKSGSEISIMKYQEVQNDYQSYWQVIKDQNQPPALIANCMRNIIEYFFGFIEKNELSNVFQKEIFRTDKYQAFYRYMNRESHSIGQNIFDIKEFNHNDFKDAFKTVFKESGYETHYKRMIK